jgi:ABC-type uncharacterized transport system permease subunit
MPTPGQLSLLILAIALFAIGGAVSVLHFAWDRPGLRLVAKQCLYWGLLASLAVLVWHSVQRGNWLPLEDNFDAFLWLAILLTLFVLYVQRTKPITGIDFFLMPVVILLLIAAAVFGREKPRAYTPVTWLWVHRVTAYGGAVAFAVAGAVGAMYLITNARLRRRKQLPAEPGFGSLERLEHFTRISVTLGFALLTIALVTGLVRVLSPGSQTQLGPWWFLNAKVVLAFAVWIIYALVLHAPINPVFRGRRAAMLSVLGFLIMVGTLVAVQFVPGGGGGGGGGAADGGNGGRP